MLGEPFEPGSSPATTTRMLGPPAIEPPEPPATFDISRTACDSRSMKKPFATVPTRAAAVQVASGPAISQPSDSRCTASDLLGGPKLLGESLIDEPTEQPLLQAHLTARAGLPYAALFYLIDHAKALDEVSVAHVLDISVPTLRRQRKNQHQTMPTSTGGKVLQLAEAIARAQDVFGDREEAQRWLLKKAMGLDGRRPIELLATPQGADLVMQFLERLEYGVYN